jgi:4-diphosphocytidyl-2-C-methyl-D-erythritol kinase
MAGEVQFDAPAKINLILRILHPRVDGYHELCSLMQTVQLVDTLYLRLREQSVEVRLTCSDPTLPVDGSNLVLRAAHSVLAQGGLRVGIDIALTKRIPVGAGLGGGSSDAATTIMALNHLLNLKLSIEQMAHIGASLGSDVPFFIMGPTAWVAGRGEQVQPVTLHGGRWVVLVKPVFGVETRWAYRQLAQTRAKIEPLSQAHDRLRRAAALSWDEDEIEPLMVNDFEEALHGTHPQFAEIRAVLKSEGATVAMLSGSGSTVFGLFIDHDRAVLAASRIRAVIADVQTFVVRTSAS